MVIIEEQYESRKRKQNFTEDTPQNEDERLLLPVKIGRNVTSSVLKKKKTASDTIKEDVDDHVQNQESDSKRTVVEFYAEQMAKSADRRRNIALNASKVLANPETEGARLKEIQTILDSIDVRCEGKLWMFAVATLCELYKDILPNYRLRVTTEAEKKQKAKKETKQLRQSEEQLLSSYKRYLAYLEGYLPKKLASLLKQFSVPKSVITQLSCVVVRCFGEILIARPAFNFSQNILRVLVPLTNAGTAEISDLACHYVGSLFRVDKSQEIAIEAVRNICRYIKNHKFAVRPAMVKVFLNLKIREVDFDAPAREREEKRLLRLKFKLLSKKEQKRQKDLEKVNKQLEAAGAVENEKRKLSLQTAIVEQLFSVYFFVLKSAATSASNSTDTPLLSAVLEGMAHFSKFMSVDYYDDLFRTFGILLESGKLSPHESLNCIRSAFKMMQGDGESLDVDPARFYRHLYIILVTGDFNRWPSEDFIAMLDCLDYMLIKRRKHLSDERLFAFAKRIATVALSCASDSAYSLSLLALLRSLFGIFPSLDRLLDSSPYRPGGIFRPDVEDPEHCSAEGAFLYELSLLQSSSCLPLVTFAKKFANEHYNTSIPTGAEGRKKVPLQKLDSSVDLDTYCRMSPSEIFIRHSLNADLAACERKEDKSKSRKNSKKQPNNNASSKKQSPVVNGFKKAIPPKTSAPPPNVAINKQHAKKPVVPDSKQWNRRARRAHRFGKPGSK